MKKSLFLLFCLSLLTACVAPRSTVSKSADLDRYKYAAVINSATYHIPAELMEYEIQLFDAVEASGLKLVSEYRIPELTAAQQEQLLIAKFAVNSTSQQQTVVTINFIDYMSGRPIVSCRGAYGVGIDPDADIRGAIRSVTKQIQSTFGR